MLTAMREFGTIAPQRLSTVMSAPYESCRTYEEWSVWAQEQDRRSGADLWRQREESRLYDHPVIRLRYDELVEIRRSGDPARLVFYLNEGLHGNMGGMGSPPLYRRSQLGTKHLIERYLDELVAALNDLELADEAVVGAAEKLALLDRASACFGCSALMLGGAGSLGAFHVGVARALAKHDLIPTVVSGASAGSIVAALVGTRSRAALLKALSRGTIAESFRLLRGGDESGRRARLRLDDLRAMVEATIPDMTFLEALEETGRKINISVAPASLHQRSRLLNAITSPNALIREAVMASCAIPGIFPPVTLAARDSSGQRRPYVSSRQWVDGSMTDDLPARRLARLYGVNHFISSQANPLIFWALPDPHASDDLASRLLEISLSASQETLRAIYPFAMRALRPFDPLNRYARLWFSVMTQQYGADVNITLDRRFFDPRLFLARLPETDAERLVHEGERATWPKIKVVRNCTKISRQIDAARCRLRSRLPEAERASA